MPRGAFFHRDVVWTLLALPSLASETLFSNQLRSLAASKEARQVATGDDRLIKLNVPFAQA
jgi:hypothetical protein